MDSNVLFRLLRPEIFVFLIPLVAIIGGVTIKIVKMIHTHNERIAMIQHGVHPDYPPEDIEVDSNSSKRP
jgi:hypothetical protein